MNIKIISTPQNKIRSNQLGDWWLFGDDTYVVHVLETLTPEGQLAVAIHELIEAVLCRKHGVNEHQVCAFDDHYEAERKEGQHTEDDEPGDHPLAPYRKEHQDATFVERAVCHVLGISWPMLWRLVPHSGEDRPRTSNPGPLPTESPEPPPQHALD